MRVERRGYVERDGDDAIYILDVHTIAVSVHVLGYTQI